MTRRSFFLRLWLRSLTVRRPQAALAIGSLIVGGAVASVLLNLYQDAQRKMTEEFRTYGANVVLSAPASKDSGEPDGVMDQAVMAHLEPFERSLNGFMVVPMLSAVVRLKRQPPEGQLGGFRNAVAVGASFSALRRLYSSWRIEGVADELGPATCVLGTHLAVQMRVGLGDSIELKSLRPGAGHTPIEQRVFRVVSLLSSGAAEDDQLFVRLGDLQRLTAMEGKISLVQLRVPGGTAKVEGAVRNLAQAFPGLEARPVREIVYSEGKVLETIRGLLASLTTLIVITIALCVAATMTAIALERRQDIAMMKALGASDHLVMQLFLSEGATLGLVGGAVGFVLGGILAHGLARRLFDVPLSLTWWTLPLICLSSMILATLATLFPIKVVRGIQPAVVLKGE